MLTSLRTVTYSGGSNRLFWATSLLGLSGLAGSASSSRTFLSPDENASASSTPPRVLFVWDFDWTCINCNSDEYIPAQFLDHDTLNEGFRKLLKEGNDWHACVERMVQKAMDEKAATPDTILDAARRMPYLASVRSALDAIYEKDGADQMILSDGNTLFIGAFLRGNGLHNLFTYGVISNEGKWTQSEAVGNRQLTVVHQSSQYGGHDCGTCPANLCKTQALRNVLSDLFRETSASKKRPKLVYVGDGANDACPALNVLGIEDVLLARVGKRPKFANERSGPETDEQAAAKHDEEEGGFGILPALRRRQEGPHSKPLACRMLQWQNGEELKAFVEDILREI